MKNIGVFSKYALSTLAAIAFGLIFALCGERLPHTLGTFSSGIVCWACFVSAITDVKSYKIYDVVTYPAFILLFAAQLVRAASFEPLASTIGPGAASAALGFLLCFVAVVLPFAFGVGGAGDAKLAAVIGIGLGAAEGVYAVGSAFVFAVPYVLTVFAIKNVLAWVRKSKTTDSQSDEDRDKVKIAAPMGPEFLLGAIFASTGLCGRMLEFTV